MAARMEKIKDIRQRNVARDALRAYLHEHDDRSWHRTADLLEAETHLVDRAAARDCYACHRQAARAPPTRSGPGSQTPDRLASSPQESSRHVFPPNLTPQEAAEHISDGQTVGFSGFTPAGAAKLVPRALAARARGCIAPASRSRSA